MRRARSESWRFPHDISQNLHALLYVRDVLGLEARAKGDVPPLTGDVPDRTELLGAMDRQEASKAWPGWWARAVAAEAATYMEPRRAEVVDRLRPVAERHRQVADPPEWSSLADHPALQHAARLLYAEGCRWAVESRRPFLLPERRDVFEWHIVRDTAEATAATHNVSMGTVKGCALVLLVDGRWWDLISPGTVLCSIGVATDPQTSEAVLRQAFTSVLSA